MNIGDVIGLLIKKKGMTQKEVAEKIGKSPTSISQIVSGVYQPSSETLKRICDVLEVPPAILHFLTISENDIPDSKKDLYQMLAPSLKDFVFKVFGSTDKEVSKLLK